MREIYIHGGNQREESNDIDYISATNFYKKLHELERQNRQTIIVHIHTVGGEYDDGMAMYDNILYSPSPIYAIGHGCVYSIGTVIMQAAKKRFLMPNCGFMIHYGSCYLSGEHKTAVNTMQYYKNLEDNMFDIYAAKCVEGNFFKERNMDFQKTKAFIKKQLDKTGDWYLFPDEAVEYGFVDKVLTKKEYNNVRKIAQRNNKQVK